MVYFTGQAVQTEVHVVQRRKQRSNPAKFIVPRATFAQHNKFKSLLKQLQKCETEKRNFKRKYLLAKKY